MSNSHSGTGRKISKSHVDRLYPSEARVTLKGKRAKAMADLLTTVSKMRLINRAGRLSGMDRQRVEHAVRVQLGLSALIEEV